MKPLLPMYVISFHEERDGTFFVELHQDNAISRYWDLTPCDLADFFASEVARCLPELNDDPRNDQDFDTWNYGTEPLPGDKTWRHDDPTGSSVNAESHSHPE